MNLDITILCKVVDNYGDIGFVFRLARSISKLNPNAKLRLIVSNLNSFASMAPQINPNLSVQEYSTWQVLDWNATDVCKEIFTKQPPKIILECFQCGRPEWLDSILFCKQREITKQIVHIINVEYLTAESWADDFHLLKGATRSPYVKKINFMPGFTNKTAGLILEDVQNKSCLLNFISKEDFADLNNKNTFCILVFSYKKDFLPEVKAIKKFISKQQQKNSLFKVHVFCAQGLSLAPFIDAWQKEGKSFLVTKLPYLPQYAWDTLLTCCQWNFIRGEDSFSRSCLSGIPFIWHAYQQEEEFQLVKVKAFLLRLKPFLQQKDFALYARYSLIYSRRFNSELAQDSKEAIDFFTEPICHSEPVCHPELVSGSLYNNIPKQNFPCTQEQGEQELENILFLLLQRNKELKKGFKNFADSLIQNGNLAKNLLDYIENLV